MHLSLRSHRGYAILVTMIILVLLTITTTVFLEKIWGFSQSSNGIEASNKAYYNAIGLIEQQLIDPNVNKYHPWMISGTGAPPSTAYGVNGWLQVFTGGTSVPTSGKGNSPFDPDHDYSLISLGDPVQLVIPEGITWGSVKFYFRVPQIGSAGTGVDSSVLGSGAILWTLGYTGASLFASGETNIFKLSDLAPVTPGDPVYVTSMSGITNSGSSIGFDEFYGAANYLGAGGANCTGYNCTLKLSLIRPIRTSATYPNGTWDERALPFLEYKIEFNKTIPSQYMTIQSNAYAYGFMRSRIVTIPQITTNTALDFAVLQ